MAKTYIIGVVGNPNCGKTTLFNALTGSKQRVGNWPGVTVERKTGIFRYEGNTFELVDLPGTYSLDVESAEVSLDEKIARDFVAERQADLILNIVDASNIERNLYLTSQLLEMRVPMLVSLNMMDVARESGIDINIDALAEGLDSHVIPVVAASGEGIDDLKKGILESVEQPHVSSAQMSYPNPLQDAVAELNPLIHDIAVQQQLDPLWLSLHLLEGDVLTQSLVDSNVIARVSELQAKAEDALDEDIDIVLADVRYGFVSSVTSAAVSRQNQVQQSVSDRIDRVVLNRALGIPIFMLAMYLMFMFTINLGGAFIDFFDMFTGALLVDGLGQAMHAMGSPDWLTLLIAGGIGGGIQVVATFIPVIGFLYLFLSALEDSGYMARAAFVMDRAMRAVGLPGKAFVPLIVGFGCNVPAIMATRTMEQQRDRMLTIIMAPFMSCGARLPVYALFAAAFFPVGGQNIVFGLYLIGIAVAVLTGFIMKSTILQGQTAPFVMELPPYHIPTLKGVFLRTWERTRSFMFRAGRVIVPMVLVLNVLNDIGTDGSYGNEDSENSVLSEIGRTMAPAFSPMGLDEENWPATVGIFTGVLAKEAVVGTLDALYSEVARKASVQSHEVEPFDLWQGIAESFATIPANLADTLGSWADPLGLSSADISTLEAAATEQEVTMGTFGEMQSRFDGTAGAFAYLLFILLYFPCTAALAAVYRETNLRWTLFVAGWTTGLAYIASTIYYQAANLGRDPGTSSMWIALMLAIFASVMFGLRHIGQRQSGLFTGHAHSV